MTEIPSTPELSEAPPEAIAQRATTRPAPPGVDTGQRIGRFKSLFNPPKAHDFLLHLEGSAPRVFYSDISEFQPVVDGRYPYPILCIRGDSGWKIDDHAPANWAFAARTPRIQLVIVYVVYVGPEQNAAIVARLKSWLGPRCPAKVAFRIDEETGADFAGPGEHSAGLNDLWTRLSDYAGTAVRVDGYANGGDWGTWSAHPASLKRVLANYSSNPTPPGFYGRQYYGGLNYPVPAGYPTSLPGMGQWVDMDVYEHPLTDVLAAYGISHPKPDSPAPGRLLPGRVLRTGQSEYSADGAHRLVMQADGNLVLYHQRRHNQGTAIWATGTNSPVASRRGRYAAFQHDGNFVVYDAGGRARWASYTNGRYATRLSVQRDGNLCIYSGETALWATSTSGR